MLLALAPLPETFFQDIRTTRPIKINEYFAFDGSSISAFPAGLAGADRALPPCTFGLFRPSPPGPRVLVLRRLDRYLSKDGSTGGRRKKGPGRTPGAGKQGETELLARRVRAHSVPLDTPTLSRSPKLL